MGKLRVVLGSIRVGGWQGGMRRSRLVSKGGHGREESRVASLLRGGTAAMPLVLLRLLIGTSNRQNRDVLSPLSEVCSRMRFNYMRASVISFILGVQAQLAFGESRMT